MPNFEKPEKAEIEYSAPADAIERGDEPHHKIELHIDGHAVGYAEADYRSRPIPHYEVSTLWIFDHEQGKGYGSKLLEEVGNFLAEKNKPGILLDAIPEDSKAKGMYARHGWVQIPGIHAYVHNWPGELPLKNALESFHRYKPASQRKNADADELPEAA